VPTTIRLIRTNARGGFVGIPLAAYAADFAECDVLHADGNADGIVNTADCDPFMQLLLSSP